MWGGARACRVCLAGQGAGAGLRPARPALQRAYQQAAGLPFQEECGMPRQLCYMCAALLVKFSIFHEKCRRSHFLLRAIYDAHDQITGEGIAKIDREASHLTSPYAIKTLESIDFDPLPPVEGTIVKDEDVPEVQSDDASMQDEPLINYKRMKGKRDKNTEKKTKEAKALKKESNKSRKKMQTVSSEEIVIIEESDVTKGTLPEQVKPPKKQRKKGVAKYPKSFYEEFATITYLTLDQQFEEILKRQETSNYKDSPLKCTLCYKGFLEESAYNNHMAKHDSASGEFECNICRRRFKTSHFLNKHVTANHIRRFTCKQCQHVCTSASQARMHEKWHKGTSYKCPHCDDSFLKFTSYLGHIRIKHPSMFVCEMCGNAFVSEMGIVLHKKLAHRDELPSTEGPLCSECDIRFASEDAYKKHLLTSAKHNLTNDCLYACNECGQTFEERMELRNHMRHEHGHALPALRRRLRRHPGSTPADNNYPRKCDQCPLEVTNGRDYWMHFRRAHKDLPYPKQASKFTCEVCGRGFQVKALLVYHHRQHTGEKPYKCNVCNRGFTMNTYLVKHMYMHTGDRPFVCSVCGKGFQTKANLNRHVMIHTGDFKYPCEYCEKKYHMPSELKTHIKHVHMKVPWPKKKSRGGVREPV